MTSKELNERFLAIERTYVMKRYAKGHEMTLDLIRDCIEAVTPEKVDSSKYKYEDSAQDFALGYIQCSIEVERNTKELLG